MENVLLPNEVELYVECMEPQSMQKLGSEQWLEWHQRLQRLNQQAAVEAAALKEEHVKEVLVSFGKVSVLVHEAILINIWKYKILPKLLDEIADDQSTFIAYSILYHEGSCVSLLELVTFHSSCCEALEQASIDLLDYVCGLTSQLLNIKLTEPHNNKETSKQELNRQRSTICYEIAIRCLTILRYLTENMHKLPIGVCSKLYRAYDVPVLLVEVLSVRPWIRSDRNKQFVGGKWKDWDGEQLGPVEGQVWLTLRHLLLDAECPNYYNITKNRRSQLVKLIPLITPTLLDQLSPLIELKHWLCKISCMDECSQQSTTQLLLEPVLDIKSAILKECNGKWRRIAQTQFAIVFPTNTDYLQEAAKKLTEAYNTELLEKFEVTTTCAKCDKNAIQRCSRCKSVWYCSRACQVDDWIQHKVKCDSLL